MNERQLLFAIGNVKDCYIEEMQERAIKPHAKKRLWLVAALIALVTMLVGCGILYGLGLFGSPAEMISAIFGNETGFDSKEVTLLPNPGKPERPIENPGFMRVPAEEAVVESVAPHVSAISKSLTFHDVTLTIDSFLYDSQTACGLVTYRIEAPKEKLTYEVEPNGRIWFQSLAEPDFSKTGASYIITEKTTDTKLSATYYFVNPYWDADEAFSVRINDGMTGQAIMALNEEAMVKVKAEYTPEEALAAAKEILTGICGEQEAERVMAQYEDPVQNAYEILREDYLVEKSVQLEQESYSPDKIVFNLVDTMPVETKTLADGAVIVGPFSLWLNAEHMDFLDPYPDGSIHSDSIREIVLRFRSGEEYLVYGEDVDNTILRNAGVVFGDGTSDMANLTIVFNRILDVKEIVGVSINGTEIEIQ